MEKKETDVHLLNQQTDAFNDKDWAEDRYRNLVDHAPDGITIVDADTGLFVDEANPQIEAFYGASRDEILGKLGPADFSPKYQPDGRNSATAAFALIQLALEGGAQRFEWVHCNAQGAEFPCEVTLIRFPDPTRRLVRASLIDLSEQKKAEQARLALESKLAHSQRLEMIGQMTGGVAHDFNNLLSALLVNLELLEQRAEDEETAAIVQSAIDATEQGAGLTNAMLNYARQAPLKPEELMLSDIVRKMENLISRTIPARITLKTDFTDELWAIEADPSNTQSAILNLVLNACDAIANDGHIQISLTSVTVTKDDTTDELVAGSYVVLSVQDSGEGIPRSLIGKIDAPFFTTKGVGQHSGLGLSMVHGFMSQSGGHLHIESTVGDGTKINLFFPATDRTSADLQTSSSSIMNAKDAVQTNSSEVTGCILLVEDNEPLRRSFGIALRKIGYEVLMASCTDSAVHEFNQAESLDLIITDIAIPGKMQGPQLAQYLKKSSPRLKVIFISGYSFGLETKEAGLVESDILLTKPFRSSRLVETVKEVLS